MTRPTAIIQARMGSTRLPGKVLRDLCGHPVLWHVVTRARAADLPVVVATTYLPEDQPIRRFCVDHEIAWYGGHPTDVLERYYQCALSFKADPVVRLTADCPLVDPKVIGLARAFYLGPQPLDLVGARLGEYPAGYPDGTDVEVFSLAALRLAWATALRPSDREHVTRYLWRTVDRTELRTVQFPNLRIKHDNIKLSIDTEDEFQRVKAIYDRLWPTFADVGWFGLDAVYGVSK